MEIDVVAVTKPETVSLILGQSHFIKTVEDIHEAMVNSVPGIKFGVAFCEASGERLVRVSGTDEAMQALATQNALAIGAGHSFVLMLAEGFYPINVLGALRAVPEVVGIFCADRQRRRGRRRQDGERPRGSRRHRRRVAAGRRRRSGRGLAQGTDARVRLQAVASTARVPSRAISLATY